MSRDSTDDLIEEMKGMEEKSLGRSLPSNRRNYEVGGEYCCYFPILDLPNELIAHIFSFLSIEDRMKARVHKKLNAIELESKYFVQSLKIWEASHFLSCLLWLSKKNLKIFVYYSNMEQGIIFNASKIYSSDCIRRISQNVSIGQISIKLYSQLNPYLSYYREMYHLLKNVDIDHLILDFENFQTFVHIEFVLTRSFFVELRRVCRLLVIPFVVYSITAKDLHELYKVMIDCSSKLKIREMGVGMNNWHDFLSLIGITINFGHPFSTRHIEV
ncbi:hypothetical protein PMAYCL1PPCAC_01563, partial [Pristionchus mayeri]